MDTQRLILAMIFFFSAFMLFEAWQRETRGPTPPVTAEKKAPEAAPLPEATTPIPTKGKKVVETPEWTFAVRADLDVTENLHFGLQGKKVDERFATDLNDQVAPAYTVFDLDLTYKLEFAGLQGAELQLNVTNLLDEDYFGSISSATAGPDGDRLAGTAYIQRLNTAGGVAPSANECNAGTVGISQEIPYTADYWFWKKTRK